MNTEITETRKCGGLIFYDAGCEFCAFLARRFRALLASRSFELLPLQTLRRAERLHLLDAEWMAEMHVVRPDGKCLGGADALIEIARDFWWAWPIRQLARIPQARQILRGGYRWIARNRGCADGNCEIVGPKKKRGISDFLPLMLLPAAAFLIRSNVAPWVFMWTMAFALYGGCKWLSYREVYRRGVTPQPMRVAAYLLAWPGMDAANFLNAGKFPGRPWAGEWPLATAKIAFGVIAVWFITPSLLPAYPILAGWVGMSGFVFILHFGLFHLLSLFWQRAGFAVTPVMRSPVVATSLTEFWGRRWNTAFNALAIQFAFRPLRNVASPVAAAVLVFGVSGVIHELVISLPAGGGYGLPTLYFLIQGCGAATEHSRAGRAIGLGRGLAGWLFTLLVTAGPAYWLFHPLFIKNVILPMLNAIGAA